jgi:hypothetical protein
LQHVDERRHGDGGESANKGIKIVGHHQMFARSTPPRLPGRRRQRKPAG